MRRFALIEDGEIQGAYSGSLGGRPQLMIQFPLALRQSRIPSLFTSVIDVKDTAVQIFNECQGRIIVHEGIETGLARPQILFRLALVVTQLFLFKGAPYRRPEAHKLFFEDVVRGPLSHDSDRQILAARARNDDKGDVEMQSLEQFQRAWRIQFCHLVIGQYDVGGPLEKPQKLSFCFQALSARLEPASSQFVQYQLCIIRMVFQDQYADGKANAGRGWHN